MDIDSAIASVVRRLEAEALDDFEVFGLMERGLVIEAKRQMVETSERSQSRGIAVRTIRGGKVGNAATTDLSPKAVRRVAEQALTSMGISSPSDEAVIAAPQEPVAGFVEPLGRSFAEIPDEEKIRLALELEAAAIAADRRVVRVQHPRYEESVRMLVIMNSKGVSACASRGLTICGLKAVASDGPESESAYEFDYSPRFEDLNAKEVAVRAARRAVGKLGAGRIGTGVLPVILEPRAAAAMVKLLAPSFFADNVQRGKSRIAGQIGSMAYSSCVTIVDDGLYPRGFASFPFDGEGTPRRPAVMVEEGVVKAWLYDAARAAKDGVQSTGNCERDDLKKSPAIGMTNCYLKAGSSLPEDLIGEVNGGLLISDFLGAHTANTVSGDFSFGAEGMLVEGGRVSGPVRGITIAGNVHELFSQVTGVGRDLRFFGQTGAPTVVVKGLMISG